MDLLTSFGDRNEYYEQEEKAEHVICVCVCIENGKETNSWSCKQEVMQHTYQ